MHAHDGYPGITALQFSAPHTLRAGTTVEGSHGVQALHHRSGGAAAIIGQTFIHILTAVTIALPAWEKVIVKKQKNLFRLYMRP